MIVVIDRQPDEGLQAVDWCGLPWGSRDRCRMWRPGDSVERARLTGGARRFVVHIMLGRTGRIDVRTVPHPVPPFANARNQKSELGDQREDGRRSPNDRARGTEEGGTHHK